MKRQFLILIAGLLFTATATIAVVLAMYAMGSPLRLNAPAVIVVTPTPSNLSVASLFETTNIPPTSTPTPEPTLTPTQVLTPQPLFPPATTTRTGCQSYEVQSGDTLIYIAAISDITLDDLLRANNLTLGDTTRLQIGQKLVIPLNGCQMNAQAAAPKAPTAQAQATRIPRTAIVPTTPPQSDSAARVAPGNLDLSKFRIIIPSLNVNIPVVTARFIGRTWDFAPIVYSGGLLDGLALPGMAGNVVIGAHSELAARRPGPFYRLSSIKPGEDILLTYQGVLYRYVVERVWIVVPADLGPIDQGVGDVLTLLTCDGYNGGTGIYETRFIVRAIRVG